MDGSIERRQRLDKEDIKAVLEAQRAKIAALQKSSSRNQQQPGQSGHTALAHSELSRGTHENKVMINNPVFGQNHAQSPGDGVADHSARERLEPPTVAGLPEYPVANLFDKDGGDRSYLFLKECTVSGGAPGPTLKMLPPQLQESMLTEDLLFSFGGFQGTWIKFKFEKDDCGRSFPKFIFDCESDLDPSTKEMVLKMIPLSKYVMIVRRFSETRMGYSHGLVNQALAGSIRGMLLDWDLMLAQIESQMRSGKAFTLQALWYYVQSPLAAFQLVAKISSDVCSRNLRGASTLSYLHKKSEEVIGDPLASRFMARILGSATEPYFVMLERWICEASLDDPYEEFVVSANDKIDVSPAQSSIYWTDKYKIRTLQDSTADVPSFLENCLHELLNTGKYLDLTRCCGKNPLRPLAKGIRLEYDEDGKYLSRIREAHKIAADTAVAVLHEHNVLQGLESMKKYFLTAQGDLFLAFMDAGDMDLKSTNIPMQQLQDVLQLSVQASSASSDPVASSLQIVYGSKSLHQIMLDLTRNSRCNDSDLKPIHSMSVSATERSKMPARNLAMLYYKVPWPLVVVTPDSAVAQYQAFFKHLFDLKWVERELNKTCKLYQVTRSLANYERRASRLQEPNSGILSNPAMRNLMLACNTCQSMVHFFRQYLLYSSFELLDPLWKSLESSLRKSASVDEMIGHHMQFLEKAMKGLFLSRKLKLPPALFKVEELALEFAKLTFTHLDIDYMALDRAAESSVQLDNLKGPRAEMERRRFKSRRVRAVLDAALTNPQYESQLREVSIRFKTRCRDFLTLLMDAYEDSKKSKQHGSRDDLESLCNLIERLDFNGYFCKTVGVLRS